MIVLAVNIINLVFRVLLNFLMPKFLETDVYADYKFFQLLVGYIGILHFGFVDGVYIKYGGKNYDGLTADEIGRNLISLVSLEVMVTAIVVAVGLLIRQPIVIFAASAIISSEIMWLYQYTYQATGEFQKYGRITSLSTILLSVLIMGLMFVGCQNSYFYMAAYSAQMFLIAVILLGGYRLQIKGSWFRPSSIYQTCKENISTGIFVMVGNFASQLLTSMDRWFIKVLMTNADFAQYSFAASLESFVSIAVTPFSVTLYNFFCREPDETEINRIEEEIYVFAVSIIACAFPVKWVLEHYLNNYLASNSVLFYLFASKGINIVIACVFLNLYKALKMQKQYSVKMALVIVIGFLTNCAFYLVLKNKEAFAIATLFTNIIWFIICKMEFRRYRLPLQSEVYIVLEILIYILIGMHMSSVVGFIVYVIITIALSALLMREPTIALMKAATGIIKRKRIR